MFNLSRYRQSSINAFIFIVITSIAVHGCSSNKPKEIEIKGEISATETLNPDVNGESRPVNLLVFYMKEPSAFEGANFMDLYRTAGDVLGENMLKMSSYQVLPGESRKIKDRAPEATNAVGVVAAFRDIDQSEWKAVIATPEKCYLRCPNSLHKDTLYIDLTRLTVKVRLGK